jgi:hypothetical protein
LAHSRCLPDYIWPLPMKIIGENGVNKALFPTKLGFSQLTICKASNNCSLTTIVHIVRYASPEDV